MQEWPLLPQWELYVETRLFSYGMTSMEVTFVCPFMQERSRTSYQDEATPLPFPTLPSPFHPSDGKEKEANKTMHLPCRAACVHAHSIFVTVLLQCVATPPYPWTSVVAADWIWTFWPTLLLLSLQWVYIAVPTTTVPRNSILLIAIILYHQTMCKCSHYSCGPGKCTYWGGHTPSVFLDYNNCWPFSAFALSVHCSLRKSLIIHLLILPRMQVH